MVCRAQLVFFEDDGQDLENEEGDSLEDTYALSNDKLTARSLGTEFDESQSRD